MIEDEVVREVRTAREAYAELHGFNIPRWSRTFRPKTQPAIGRWSVMPAGTLNQPNRRIRRCNRPGTSVRLPGNDRERIISVWLVYRTVSNQRLITSSPTLLHSDPREPP